MKLRLGLWELSGKTNMCHQKNSDIMCNIEPQTPISQRTFGLCREDLEKVKRMI